MVFPRKVPLIMKQILKGLLYGWMDMIRREGKRGLISFFSFSKKMWKMYNSRKKTFGNFEIILDTVYGVELMRINSIWIILKRIQIV